MGTLSPLDTFWTAKETRVKECLFPLGDAPDQSLSSPGAEGTYPAAVTAIQGKGHRLFLEGSRRPVCSVHWSRLLWLRTVHVRTC